MTTYNIFGTEAPTTLDQADSSQYTFGVAFTVSTASTATAVRIYKGSNSGHAADQVAIYNSSGTLLGSGAADLSGAATNSWNSFNLSSPVALSTGTTYIVAYHCSSVGKYPSTASRLGSAVTSGILSTVATGGRYTAGTTLAAPTTTTTSWYGLDVTVNDTALLQVTSSASPAAILTSDTSALTATATGGSGTKTYAWTKVSGPSCSFSAASSASTTFTPTGGAGSYVLRCTVTDSSGSATGDVTVTVSSPSSYVYYSSLSVSTNWTATGGTTLAAISDTNGGTFITSANNPASQELTGTLGALSAPPAGQGLTVVIDCDKLNATTGSLTLNLKEGSTQRSTVTVSSIPNGSGTTVSGQVTATFPAADMAAVTSWASLTLQILATAAP